MRRHAPWIPVLPLLAGCLPAGNYHSAATGEIATARPALFARYELDRAACEGQAARPALVAGPYHDPVQRELVVRGCMADRGWIVRPAR